MTARAEHSRIGPLDTFRFLAVTFALVSHCLLEFRVDAVMDPEAWLWLRSVTRSSTPGLLILFGIMAEVVYYRRYREAGASLRPRLYRRAFQCYLAFVALAVLVVVSRPESLSYLLRSFGFLTLEGYNVIFALYCFLLLLLVPLLPLRHRWGFAGPAAVVAAVWLLDALLVSRLPDVPPALSTIGDVTFGLGGIWGPSAFHSLSLVIAGMAFGRVLYGREGKTGAAALSAALVAASCLVIGLEVAEVGVRGFFAGIVDLARYRARNHPAYYAYGILGTFPVIVLAYTLDALLPRRATAWMNAVGGKTFSYFFLGNALIIVVPDPVARSVPGAVAWVGGYLLLFCLVTLLWARAGERVRISGFRLQTTGKT